MRGVINFSLNRADRYCNKTTVINGVTIPKGAVIVVPICVIHHSPLYWRDPEEFDPDRFENVKHQAMIQCLLFFRFTAEERAKRPQLSHMPFGFGPRNCIGMRLALLEAKVALIEVLKRYTFVKVPETEVCVCILTFISVSYTHLTLPTIYSV